MKMSFAKLPAVLPMKLSVKENNEEKNLLMHLFSWNLIVFPAKIKFIYLSVEARICE